MGAHPIPTGLSGGIEAEGLTLLEKTCETHFAGPIVHEAISFAEQFEVPPEVGQAQRPILLSRHPSASGSDARFPDDLSERIYVADHALKAAGVKRRKNRIAEALNPRKLRAGRKQADSREWVPEDINDRVKSYGKYVKTRWGPTGPDILVERWVARFRDSGLQKSKE